MFRKERKEIKRLKKSILKLELSDLAVRLRAVSDKSIDIDKAAEKTVLIRRIWRKEAAILAELETNYLVRKAESWGIEVPRKRDWFVVESKTDTMDTILLEAAIEVRDTLNNLGKAVITKQIREARFAYWKAWADILIPILALVVAIIALLKR